MKDREKQIEEIETIIKSNLAEGSFANAFARKVAIQVVEYYQSKLPKDDVVISGLELADYKHYKEYTKSLAMIEKETEEKDFNTIIKALEERKERVKAFYGIAESVGVDIAIRTVEELARQFGIEIKED